ncbi:MAG: BREX-6 system BrxE protein [Deltaproteobacteria bacterium]|nr:BREX-6 system BrxE protein [Deltaproteobacteria bacterium]
METSDGLSNEQLDLILAVQLTVAWAGESGGDPPRLGWWESDLVDADAAGDLFSRLIPRTQKWAGLEAVRAAAIRIDDRRRAALATPDRSRTLFHLGFRTDERLRDRLLFHKRHNAAPATIFGKEFGISDNHSLPAFEAYLKQFPEAQTKVIPGAREVTTISKHLTEQVTQLASALLPISKEYPLPFLIAEGS